MIQGSSVRVRTRARPLKACCSSSAAANPNDELKHDRPEHPDDRIPQRQPEHRVLDEAQVVAEPDEVIVLRLVQHVVVQAHLDRQPDRHDDGGEHAQRGRYEVGVADHELPHPPADQPAGAGPCEGDRDRGHAVPDAQVISFFRISAKRSRHSFAEIFPRIACWISRTHQSESICRPSRGRRGMG